jgi:hypothetical protein
MTSFALKWLHLRGSSILFALMLLRGWFPALP